MSLVFIIGHIWAIYIYYIPIYPDMISHYINCSLRFEKFDIIVRGNSRKKKYYEQFLKLSYM